MKKSDNIRPVCVAKGGDIMSLEQGQQLGRDVMTGRWTRSDTAHIGDLTIIVYRRTFINWLKYKIFGSVKP